jgi:hypothetical protein
VGRIPDSAARAAVVASPATSRARPAPERGAQDREEGGR